jgi:hypothetical protein
MGPITADCRRRGLLAVVYVRDCQLSGGREAEGFSTKHGKDGREGGVDSNLGRTRTKPTLA